MPTISYEKGLLESLKEPGYAALYLKASLEEFLNDGDFEAFLITLEDVCKAKGNKGMGAVEQQIEQLKKAGNGVELRALSKILKQLGIDIEFKPMDRPATAA